MGDLFLILEFVDFESLNQTDNHGNTLLHIFSWAGCKGPIEYLTNYIDLTFSINDYGQTPLHVAKNSKILQYLLEMLKETEKITSYDQVQRFIGQMDFKDGNTALHYFAKKGNYFFSVSHFTTGLQSMF